MSDFAKIVESYNGVSEFPKQGSSEITYRDTVGGYEYHWVSDVVEGGRNGNYVKCNPQIREFRGHDEFENTVGVEGVLYIVHGANNTKIHYVWRDGAFWTTNKEEFFSEYPLPTLESEFKQVDVATVSSAGRRADVAALGDRGKLDVGLIARDRLTKRRTAMQKFKRLVLSLFIISLFIIGVAGYFGYQEWKNRVLEWRTDYHMCYVKIGNTVVEGQRKYRYQATTIAGFRFSDNSTVQETTYMKASGLSFRVVGHNAEGSWIKSNQTNGRDLYELPATDRYTFISANDIKVMEYAEFCGSARPIED